MIALALASAITTGPAGGPTLEEIAAQVCGPVLNGTASLERAATATGLTLAAPGVWATRDRELLVRLQGRWCDAEQRGGSPESGRLQAIAGFKKLASGAYSVRDTGPDGRRRDGWCGRLATGALVAMAVTSDPARRPRVQMTVIPTDERTCPPTPR